MTLSPFDSYSPETKETVLRKRGARGLDRSAPVAQKLQEENFSLHPRMEAELPWPFGLGAYISEAL